jgi:hypothetical protein
MEVLHRGSRVIEMGVACVGLPTVRAGRLLPVTTFSDFASLADEKNRRSAPKKIINVLVPPVSDRTAPPREALDVNGKVDELFYNYLLSYVSESDMTDFYNIDLGYEDPFDAPPDRCCMLNDLAEAIEELTPSCHRLLLIMFVSGYSRREIAAKFNISYDYVGNAVRIARSKLLRIVDKRYKISKYINHNWEM